MSSFESDQFRMARRNKLLGMWAAQKLGLFDEGAEIYSDDLAKSALNFAQSDVLGKVSSDFKLAGIVCSDDDIRRVMTEFWLQAARRGQTGGGNASDAAVVQIARNFMPK
jgi:hypothetical protein